MKWFVLCALLCMLPLQAYAWWSTGHMVVAEIALKHINATNGASEEVKDALRNAVNSLVAYADDSDTFVTASVWMDDIKNRGMRQFSNWHFINLPICDYPGWPDPDACNNISVSSILKSGDEDVLWAINEAIRTFKTNTSLGFERGFALRNLLHLVGDIHQPLHAVARYSDQTPTGDRGGNNFLITGVGYEDLHAFWDSGLGLLDNSITRPLNDTGYKYLSDLADHIIEITANLTANVTKYNVTNWAIESRNIALKYVYQLPFNSTPSAEYIATGWPIVEEQLGLAGYHLYQVLLNIRPCSGDINNCPEGTDKLEEEEKTYHSIAIALAVGVGVSGLFNIVLLIAYCKKSHHESEYPHLLTKQ